MKRSIIIWAISGIVYLGVVIAGYNVYASMNPKTDEHTNRAANEQEEEDMDNHLGHNEQKEEKMNNQIDHN
ncbi:hypothetical protein AB1L05_16510 [Cytobacillus horneckiae]|uniref:hypothetical protein n=1 Tax=Cytobacillus horneckiae TaxID=549687 RepID=UPI0039A214B5